MTDLGPVSASLEAELREQARQHGILVWLDKEGAYNRFADRSALREAELPAMMGLLARLDLARLLPCFEWRRAELEAGA